MPMPKNASPQMARCPSNEQLAAFEAGTLPPEQCQAIAEHLSDCPSCEENLHALHANNTLVLRLRRDLEGEPFLNELACRELEQLACALAEEATPATLVDKATAVREETPSLPADFAAYRLLAHLGRGGMGIVYKAEQRAIKRLTALKMVRAGIHATEEERTRFQREGLAIARVRSEHVVQIYEFGQYAGQMFFAMELLEGGTLADKLKDGPLPTREAAELVRTLARAVQAAHDQGVVHRDLKPSNVLFTPEGTAKITDFGLAKIFDDQDSDTRTDAILGTPSYMSPEQASGAVRTLGPAADVYALGAILYETLTGRPPFKAETALQIVELVRTRQPEPPSRRRPQLPPDLEAICLKCLEKEPARRYSSAAALADDLGCWLNGEPTRARPPGRLQRAWRMVRRRPRLAAAVVLLAMLVLTGTLAAYRLDPERPLRNIESRLEGGKSVILIGEKGKPAWHSLALSDEPAQISEEEGTFTVYAWSKRMTLVELVRDPRQESYRFRAEVKHRQGNTHAEVGLYVLHRPLATPHGTAHALLRWTFNDIYDLGARLLERQERFPPKTREFLRMHAAKGNNVRLSYQLKLEKKPPGTFTGFWTSLGHDTFHPALGTSMWRQLAVEVTPQAIRCFWEGQLSCERSFADSAEVVKRNLRQQGGSQPDNPFPEEEVVNISPRGRLGLYVRDGSVSFRRAVLEPLEEGK